MMRRIWSTVTSSAISGLGGASSTLMPVLWLMSVVSTSSSSAAPGSATTSMIDLFLGLRFSSTPTSPNWKEPSTSVTVWRCSPARATARFTASVVRPTPPLGAKSVTMRPAFLLVSAGPPGVPATAMTMRLRFSFSRACTWRMDVVSSSELKGLTRNSRAPASIDRRR